MDAIQQNTLYLTTVGTYIARDHLTLQVEVPVYPDDMSVEERTRESATGSRKLSISIHHLESICVFGASTISPPALYLCWEHGVAVNYLNEFGRLHARMTGVTDTSVTLRRTQFRAADDPAQCAAIAAPNHCRKNPKQPQQPSAHGARNRDRGRPRKLGRLFSDN